MNAIMTSDDASEESEFLSALIASSESFVHKALKDEQTECIHRIVCHGRCFGRATDGVRQERYISIQLISVLFRMGRTANATSKTAAELIFCWLTKWKGTFTKFSF